MPEKNLKTPENNLDTPEEEAALDQADTGEFEIIFDEQEYQEQKAIALAAVEAAKAEGEAEAEPAEEKADADAEVDVAALLKEIERVKGEQEQLREMYLRKLAEFDNFRKRTERDHDELKRTAGEALARALVPVLDNFERALEHSSDIDPPAFQQGVEMIAKQMWDALRRQGLEVIDPMGQTFKPEFHEAVQRVEGGGHEPGTVVFVLAKGYQMGGRLLRPAMVGVAVEPAKPAEHPNQPRPTEAEGEGEGAS